MKPQIDFYDILGEYENEVNANKDVLTRRIGTLIKNSRKRLMVLSAIYLLIILAFSFMPLFLSKLTYTRSTLAMVICTVLFMLAFGHFSKNDPGLLQTQLAYESVGDEFRKSFTDYLKEHGFYSAEKITMLALNCDTEVSRLSYGDKASDYSVSVVVFFGGALFSQLISMFHGFALVAAITMAVAGFVIVAIQFIAPMTDKEENNILGLKALLLSIGLEM